MPFHRLGLRQPTQRRWLALLLVLLVASCTIGIRYWQPHSLFWDENYHVASAHKQLAGVLYMEPHPPLGKMLIALGEWATGANGGGDFSRALQTDHVSNADLPANHSFVGVRLASVLCMILAAPLLFSLLRRVTRSTAVALVFALLPLFDNAIVVHTRAAMLEGPQFLFAILALYVFSRLLEAAHAHGWHYLLLGTLVGLGISVKLTGAVLLLLPAALFAVRHWPDWQQRRWSHLLLRSLKAALAAITGVLFVFLTVYYVHVVSNTKVEANRTYKASPAYLAHAQAGTLWTLPGFATALSDQLRYVREYADGVPRLDVCKPGENGSHALRWPLGGKTINYRWNRTADQGQARVSYTYLVGNPLVWWPVLGGILLSVSLLLGRWVYGARPVDRRLFLWMALFTGLYLAYMAAILRIERVMYLYHYLLPLLFGIANLACVFAYVFRDGLAGGHRHTRLNLAGYLLLVAATFAFFAPLTYNEPLTTQEFERRQWLDLWGLEPVQ